MTNSNTCRCGAVGWDVPFYLLKLPPVTAATAVALSQQRVDSLGVYPSLEGCMSALVAAMAKKDFLKLDVLHF